VILHSLQFSSEQDKLAVQRLIESSQPGDIIDITQFKPTNVLVLLSKETSRLVELTLIPSTLPNQSIIPLKISEGRLQVKVDQSIISMSGFPYDMALCLTIHKLQGDTCDMIIGNLNQRPGKLLHSIGLKALLTFLSRPVEGEDFRILPSNLDPKLYPGKSAKDLLRISLQYLKKLVQDSYLRAWLKNFDKFTRVFTTPKPNDSTKVIVQRLGLNY
jgi:hypothetical protein